MARAIYPGSFDPVTRGHLDIIGRAARVMDEVIIGVLANSAKTPLFTVEERVEMLRECTAQWPNVQVETFDGLTVEFARKMKADVMVRGLRAVTDFEYEMQIAQTLSLIHIFAEYRCPFDGGSGAGRGRYAGFVCPMAGQPPPAGG